MSTDETETGCRNAIEERIQDPEICTNCVGTGAVSVYVRNAGGAIECPDCGGDGRV